ncbi:MAG: hypothetical protein LBT81_05610 [Helicobacteraceae bacterium]|jgi:outer membrane protein assembly factor BamD (BamD/ComL family)|nr:hypothetical protein [Helicobacteraceae bacterium]
MWLLIILPLAIAAVWAQNSLDNLYKLGGKAFDAGDYEKAVGYYGEYIREAPSRSDGYLLHANAYR